METQRNEVRENLLKKTDDELQEMLLQELASEEDVNVALVESVTGIISERHPDDYEFDEHALLDSIFAIYEEEHGCDAEEMDQESTVGNVVRVRKPKTLRRVVALAAVLAVLISTMCAVTVSGMSLMERFLAWTGELFSFDSAEISKTTTPADEMQKDTTLRDLLVENGVSEQLAPIRFPEGFTLSEIVASDVVELGHKKFWAEYTNFADEQITVMIRSSEYVAAIEKDSEGVEIYSCVGIDHYIIANLDSISVTWNNGAFYGTISVYSETVTMDDVYGMIRSIYE